jgi:hypothetical protein
MRNEPSAAPARTSLLSWSRREATAIAAEWSGTTPAEVRRITLSLARERWAEMKVEFDTHQRKARP